MTTNLMSYVDEGNFVDLFQELGWDLPPGSVTPLTVDTDAGRFTVCPVADQSGLRVWVCTADTLPDVSSQRAVDAEVAKHSQVRLLIFTDGTHQSWRWPRQGATAATNSKLLHHAYTVGNLEQHEDLSRRLAKIELPMDERIGIVEIQDRMVQAFNDEAVKRSTEASRHMERMNRTLLKAGCSTDTSSSLLVRLLFLFFGDDTQMWPEDTFQKWVLNHTTAENLHDKLSELFTVLCDEELDQAQTAGGMGRAEGKYAGTEYQNFRRIDGMYQEQVDLPPLPEDFRRQVLTAGEFDWGKINPDIFGAMFQQLVDLDELREHGEHYTSEENIQKVIEPLFLDEYRQCFQEAYDDRAALLALQDELAGLQFMDPACGSGNFLIQAYKHLRGLEYEIIQRAEELELEDIHAKLEKPHVRDKRKLIARRDEIQAGVLIQFDPQVLRKSKLSMRQFYGIELNAWPAKVAATSMLLVDHLANQAWGENVVRLPIEQTPQIVHGNALRMDWGEVVSLPKAKTFIFGNPPFLGDHTRTSQQLADLQHAWGAGKQLSRLDYVTGWHALSLKFFQNRTGEFAFVATNSITQGDQTARLFAPIFDAGWRIKFAHRTFKWDSQATGQAAVHCVIVGFTKDHSVKPRLWDYPEVKSEAVEQKVTQGINAYLVDGPNILVTKRPQGPRSRYLPKVVKGSMATDGGNLVVKEKEYSTVAADPIQSKYLRPYVGSDELIKGKKRWCLWLVDVDPEDICQSAELRRRIEGVKNSRLASDAKTTREYPHHHLFRQFGLVSDVLFVAIPEVSSENRDFLPVKHLGPEFIISNKVYGAVDPDGLLFAVLSSSMFITWMKAVGGRLESRISFSSTVTWNNFPLPALEISAKEAIIEGGEKVLEARELHPERSLEDHYDPLVMSPELLDAHRALDKAVDAAFGSPRTLKSEKERLEVLFARYAEMTNQ